MPAPQTVSIRPCSRPGRFLDLQRRFYRGDPDYVPPLTLIDRRQVSPDKHPFFEHATAEFFVAERAREIVGRISVCRDDLHDEFHGDRVGFFGHFEAADMGAAHALLEHAATWLGQHGAEVMRGPVDLSTNYRCGLLVEGETGTPFVMMPHNPLGYSEYIESFGLRKTKDLLALHLVSEKLDMRRLDRIVAKIRNRIEVTTRQIVISRLDGEVRMLWDLYNRIWETNWGFSPMTEAEFVEEARSLKQVLRPELTVVLEHRGDPIGFVIGLPDTNLAVRACNGRLLPFGWLRFMRRLRTVRRFRVITLGLLPEFRKSGLDALLLHTIIKWGQSIEFHECEASWILEDNVGMLRPLLTTGARVYRRYRVYEKPLAGPA